MRLRKSSISVTWNSMKNDMKAMIGKYIMMSASILAMMLASSCQKTPMKSGDKTGFLSFSEFSVNVDETLETKSTPTQSLGDYIVLVYNADGDEVLHKTYSEVANSTSDIELRAGLYTLKVMSEETLPAAAFDQPVYGVNTEVQIEAGKTTAIGELVCTLMQCKVTVSYSDEFLASLTGDGSTKVTLIDGSPLEYALAADGTCETRAGFFAVEGNTMEVVFNGKVGGKVQKMTKVFSGIAPKQWRKIHFVPKKNEQGNATFDIEIDDMIDDEPLNIVAKTEEVILGVDPEAPKGDGGITLLPDYEGGCDEEITDLLGINILPLETKAMSIIFKAIVPAGVKKFTVDISTDNSSFAAAVAVADATHLDLINPSEANGVIFEVVPFPHGQGLLGQTEIPFDLSKAQEAIVVYKGRHSFKMTITDANGCTNEIPVVMIVE